jgi:hypothetical protein
VELKRARRRLRRARKQEGGTQGVTRHQNTEVESVERDLEVLEEMSLVLKMEVGEEEEEAGDAVQQLKVLLKNRVVPVSQLTLGSGTEAAKVAVLQLESAELKRMSQEIKLEVRELETRISRLEMVETGRRGRAISIVHDGHPAAALDESDFEEFQMDKLEAADPNSCKMWNEDWEDEDQETNLLSKLIGVF